MATVESYVVHIYRRTPVPTLVGTIERAGSGEKIAFHSASELVDLITRSGADTDQR